MIRFLLLFIVAFFLKIRVRSLHRTWRQIIRLVLLKRFSSLKLILKVILLVVPFTLTSRSFRVFRFLRLRMIAPAFLFLFGPTSVKLKKVILLLILLWVKLSGLVGPRKRMLMIGKRRSWFR